MSNHNIYFYGEVEKISYHQLLHLNSFSVSTNSEKDVFKFKDIYGKHILWVLIRR